MRVRGIGIDLVPISRMRGVVERWQERFLARVFTPDEIAYCRARKDPVPHFAARFAAKEAGLKALGTGLRLGVSWLELEVRRERGGPPVLVLRGRTRELARARGADRMLLALSHDGDYAIAQAMLVEDGEGA
jgi:holo-[acyl-carrier protein] synthase